MFLQALIANARRDCIIIAANAVDTQWILVTHILILALESRLLNITFEIHTCKTSLLSLKML